MFRWQCLGFRVHRRQTGSKVRAIDARVEQKKKEKKKEKRKQESIQSTNDRGERPARRVR